MKTLIQLLTDCKEYEEMYFLELMSTLFSETENFKVIEALTLIEMARNDEIEYARAYEKVSRIEQQLGYPVFDDELYEESSESNSYVSSSSQLSASDSSDSSSSSSDSSDASSTSNSVSSTTSGITDTSVTVTDSAITATVTTVTTVPSVPERDIKKPDDIWKYRTKELGIHYIPDVLLDVEVSFTGDLENFGRSEAIQWVNNLGGSGKNHITKKCTFVVVGKNPGASKLSSIKKYKIYTIDEPTFIAYLSSKTSLPQEPEVLNFSSELKAVVLLNQLKKNNTSGVSVCLDVPEELIELKNKMHTEISRNSEYELV